MAICDRCGAYVADGAKYCGVCRHPMNTASPAAPGQPDAGENAPRQAPEPARRGARRFLPLVISVGCLIAVLCAVLYFYRQWQPENQPDQVAAPGPEATAAAAAGNGTGTPAGAAAEPVQEDPAVWIEPASPEPEPALPELTTLEPESSEPATPEPVSPEPVYLEPESPEPATPEPISPEPVYLEPESPEPATPEPTPEPVHEHVWADAGCTEPKTCIACGATDGSPLGHDWREASCTEPKTCRRCGATEGSALGHSIQAATYLEPEWCTRCRRVFGEPKKPPNTSGSMIGVVTIKSGEKKTIRKEHDPNSTALLNAQPGAQYACYRQDEGSNGKIWYKIWVPEIDCWGWISSNVATLSPR